MLNPWKRPDFGASGAFNVAAPEDFSVLADTASLLCKDPNRLKPGAVAVGVAVGVLFGFASEANKFGFDDSASAPAFGSAGFKMLNKLFEETAGLSCVRGVCEVRAVGLNKDEDVLGAVGRLANGLPADVSAGALVVGVAVLENPNKLVDGAVVLVVSGVCVVEPKLNRLPAGAVAGVLSLPGALVPNPLKMLFGAATDSFFCALVPNPVKMLFCAGGAGCVDAPNPPKRLFVVGVLVADGADEVAAPKTNG